MAMGPGRGGRPPELLGGSASSTPARTRIGSPEVRTTPRPRSRKPGAGAGLRVAPYLVRRRTASVLYLPEACTPLGRAEDCAGSVGSLATQTAILEDSPDNSPRPMSPTRSPAALRTRARRRAPLEGAAEHAVAKALEAEGHHGVASVVKILDAAEPLVTVEATTTVDTVLQKIQRGEDPTFMELHAVFGEGGALEASGRPPIGA